MQKFRFRLGRIVLPWCIALAIAALIWFPIILANAASTFNDPARFTDTLTVDWSKVSPTIPRTNLEQSDNQTYTIPFTEFRVWDDMDSLPPSTPANDDLGIIGGTYGTNSPSLQTHDLKGAGATNLYSRVLVCLPMEYVAGQTVTICTHAGMLTTVADTSATLDVECYKSDEEAGVGADLCATAAQSINSLTLADKSFSITAGGLSPGDLLDVRITVAINDGGTGTEVKGIVGSAKLICDVRG